MSSVRVWFQLRVQFEIQSCLQIKFIPLLWGHEEGGVRICQTGKMSLDSHFKILFVCVTISAWILLQYSLCRQAAIYISQLTYFFLSCDCSKWLPAWERSIHPVSQSMLLFLLPMLIVILIRFPLIPFQFPAMSSGCKLHQWQASNRLCCYYFRQLSLPDAQYSLSPSLCLSLSLALTPFCLDSLLLVPACKLNRRKEPKEFPCLFYDLVFPNPLLEAVPVLIRLVVKAKCIRDYMSYTIFVLGNTTVY